VTAQTNPQPDRGTTLLTWKFPEVPRYVRSRAWYVWMTMAGGALFIWSIYDRNFLFGVIVVLALTIVFFQSRQSPRILTAEITDEGIAVGKDFFGYDDIRNFWIIYKPPVVKMLYVTFKSNFRPVLGIALEDADPVKIRKELLRFTSEDLEREDEPASDAYGRLFKM